LKLRGKRKKYGRCVCSGHGQDYGISKEIQSIPVTRQFEKQEAFRELCEEAFDIPIGSNQINCKV
jgi:hypothetical protein